MFVDEWSFIHFCIFTAGAGYLTYAGVKPWAVLALALGIGLGWEFLEMYLETRQDTYDGELWYNRWISDPLVDMAGATTGMLLIRRWMARNKKEPSDE